MSCACNCTCQCVTYAGRECQPPLSQPLKGRLLGFSLFQADHLLSTNSDPLLRPTTRDFGAGPNIMAAEWPWITDTNESNPHYLVHLPPRPALQFSWHAETGHLSGPAGWNLVYTGNWELTNAEGERWTFVGFDYEAFPKGRLVSYQGPGGEGYAVYDPADPDNPYADPYTEAGNIKGLRGTSTYEGGTLSEYLDFSYASGTDGRERLQQATLRRQESGSAVENVERVLFVHQLTTASSSSSSGSGCAPVVSLYDRGTVTHQVYQQGDWASTGTTYRQYYLEGVAGGLAGALKCDLDAAAYERLKDDPAVSDPLTASDVLVAQYATLYLEYDATGRVSKRKPLDGGEVTFSYQDGYTLSDDRNKYRLQTTETRADGSVHTRYTNFQHQVLLEEFQESAGASERVLEFRQYDSQGNLTLHATPSALAGYSIGSYTITPIYQSEDGAYTVGLVHLYTYYSETTTGSGGGAVEGFQQYDHVRQGRDGTPILLRAFEYTEHAIMVDTGGSSSSSSSSSSGGATALVVAAYPLAKETRYRNEDGSGGIETRYAYSWHEGTVQMQERITTLPAIAEWQNGPGTSATRTERFDIYGNRTWLKDPRGFITCYQYAAGPGLVSRTIQDVDDAQLSVPAGWSTPTGGGQHLVTDYQYDAQDRQTLVLGPEHDVDAMSVRTASWTVYQDADHETWSAHGYAVESASSSSSSGSGDLPSYDYTLVNPVSIQKRNATGTRAESIQATRASTSGPLSASDTFGQTSFVRWSVSLFNDKSQQTATRVYHTIPSSGNGSSGTHYDETTYGYDSLGRRNRVTSPGGTITRTVFDTSSRAVCVYLGTDDSGATDLDPTAGREPCSEAYVPSSGSSSSSSSSSGPTSNNLVLVSEYVYHSAAGCAGCGGGGDSQLAATVQHIDATTFRMTEYLYDWRNRQQYVIPPADDQGRTVYTCYDFDNLDQVTQVERYQEQTPSADILLARQQSYFDDAGRIYQTRHYAVDPSDGTVGSYLVGYLWYDAAGNVIKQQAAGQRSFTKTQYDGLGRAIKQLVGYDLDETPGCTLSSSSSSSSSSGEAASYTAATNVAGDTILEQTETTLDAAGHVTLLTSRQRRHDATGTGELTTLSGSQPQARVSYQAYWFDEIGRQRAVAHYGTHGDTSLSRPSTAPARSDTVLVTTTEFDAAGQAYQTIDPAGKQDRQEFDAAGRLTKTIENYQDGSVDGDYPDEDVTVERTYHADGQLATLTAKNPSTGDQTTEYVYGTTLADSLVARTDLLRAEIYGDSDDVAEPLGDGTDGVYDRVEYKYNRQGERTEKKDQNGTVHAYQFDALGRVLHDQVTTLGTNIDGAVRRTSTAYEVRGMVERITHYDNATVGSGSVVNEVLYSYNDLGMLEKEYQEHEGAKDGNTLYVQYNFDTTASGGEFTKALRPASVRYPNGRLVHFTYSSSDSPADVLNRLDAIQDDSGGSPGAVLASYSYLGAGTIVIEDYQQPDVRLEYFFDSAYSGWDRFGRVVDQRWYDYGASTDRDRFTYGYDRASNRTYRENTVASVQDEFYSYDAIHRLATFDRGDLNVGKTAISGTPVREEDWGLDMTGNWSDLTQKTSGSTDLDQDRTHNEVNEITGISETTGTAWIDPAHDKAGNMTTLPKPSSLATGLTCKWDAWNHLVEVKEGATVVAKYEYDGLARRVKKHVDSESPASPNGIDSYVHMFYNSAWQVLETRQAVSENTGPESLQPQYQYVWSPRYIDAPVLRDENTDADGACDDARIYYLGDANFNVTTLLDTAGDASERYTYSPYGVLTIHDATWSNIRSASSYAAEYTYTGRRLDGETGLYYYRHRVYHRQLGRFCSRDPYFAHSQGTYELVGSNPLRSTDPTGLCELSSDPVIQRNEDGHCEYFAGKLGGLWGYPYSYSVTFKEPCACCEFRQYIACDSRRRMQKLGGEWGPWETIASYGVDPKVPECAGEMLEDPIKYGHRDLPGDRFDEYLPDRPDGCAYQMIDSPGIADNLNAIRKDRNNIKVAWEVYCQIVMNVIDTRTNNVVDSEVLSFSCHGEMTANAIERAHEEWDRQNKRGAR